MSQSFKIQPADAKKSSRHQRNQKAVAEMGAIQRSLLKHFGDIKDPRVERTKKYKITDIKRDCDFSSNNCGFTRMARH